MVRLLLKAFLLKSPLRLLLLSDCLTCGQCVDVAQMPGRNSVFTTHTLLYFLEYTCVHAYVCVCVTGD